MTKNNKPTFKIDEKMESQSSKIDVIKNLIFGETIQAYDDEFELLKEDILEKKKFLEELVEEIRLSLNTTLDNVSTDVNIRITDLENNLSDKIETIETDKVNKEMLGKLLVDLGEKIASK